MFKSLRGYLLVIAAIITFQCAPSTAQAQDRDQKMSVNETPKITEEEATFAGGCFWCMQPPYDKQPGVTRTVVGYTGGTVKDPTYDQIGTGRTGHTEAVRVYYDPAKVSYEALLETFWQNIDPTQADGQFADRGSQYRTAIFYHSEEQRLKAEKSKADLTASKKFSSPIVTEISPAGEFYRAEEYHQDYYMKNTSHYKLYRLGSGRESFIEKTWNNK